jgi:prepilin-type N-terminal cleavage/methylation domain-containing protein
MRKTLLKKAFTLIELLVTVALLAVLATMLVQSAGHVRQRDAQAVCLANLHTIATASLQYAAEDPRDQMVPLHRMMVSTLAGLGWGGTEWSWRTAIPCSFGGRTATVPFPTESGTVTAMMNASGLWGARTRPLNGYLPGPGSSGLKTMHCPADAGYPDSGWVTEAPQQAVGIPLFDMLGNSYCVSRFGAAFLQGTAKVAEFSVSPWGHTASSIDSPLSETVLYCDSLFSSFARWHDEPNADPIPGWHGQLLSDNVGYCDGSARLTERGELQHDPDFQVDWFLRHGPDWQLDCYPTPGSMILAYTPSGGLAFPTWQEFIGAYSGWPFEDVQYNPPP